MFLPTIISLFPDKTVILFVLDLDPDPDLATITRTLRVIRTVHRLSRVICQYLLVDVGVKLYHLLLYRIISCHIVSYHIVSYSIVSYGGK